MATYWVPDFSAIGGFSGHLWYPYWYLAMSTEAEYMALVNVFQAQNHQNVKIRLVGTGKEWVAMGTFTVVGVLNVELLACQVSMVSDAKWPR